MGNAILDSIADLARLRRIDLRPAWADAATQIQREDEEALDLYCEAIGWAPSSSYYDNPRAHEFPLLAYHDENGWGVAERFESGNRLRVSVNGQVLVWNNADKARLYDLVIPLPAGRQNFKNAFDVFKTAVFRRKQALVLAVLATIVVNLIALVTRLSASARSRRSCSISRCA